MDLDTELKSAFDGLRTRFDSRFDELEPKITAVQKQVDAIDSSLTTNLSLGSQGKSLADVLGEDEGIKRLLRDRRGKATISLFGKDAALFQRKTTLLISGTGSQTTGVLPLGRLPDITTEPRQVLTLRDMLTATPTTFQVIDFVKVSSPMTIASPVAEAATKPENAVTFTSVSERVKVIATWLPASRQILDDMPGLIAFVQNSLSYYVDQMEELQLLSGDGTGENLHGLIPQATSFNTGLLYAKNGWNKIDLIGRAVQQITAAKELPPDFIVLHPNDWWDIRLTKDGFGRYILGDPQQGALTTVGFGKISPSQNVFGIVVVPSTNITQGSFLLGSSSPVATELMDRMETTVELSTEHASFFTSNLIAVRSEKRVALITRRPGSFLSGTFTTSP